MNKLSCWSLWMLLLGLVMLTGCIADSPEDTDLPWASNHGWEGVVPMPMSTQRNYD